MKVMSLDVTPNAVQFPAVSNTKHDLRANLQVEIDTSDTDPEILLLKWIS
jgi:hypothetical protein